MARMIMIFIVAATLARIGCYFGIIFLAMGSLYLLLMWK